LHTLLLARAGSADVATTKQRQQVRQSSGGWYLARKLQRGNTVAWSPRTWARERAREAEGPQVGSACRSCTVSLKDPTQLTTHGLSLPTVELISPGKRMSQDQIVWTLCTYADPRSIRGHASLWLGDLATDTLSQLQMCSSGFLLRLATGKHRFHYT